MAATLRRTFRYPGDEDEDHDHNVREELDEQEQENLIKNLKQKNETDNRFYHTIFTVVPLIAIVAYIPGLMSSSVSTGYKLSYIICILSLSTTAYIMETAGSFDGSKGKKSRVGGYSQPILTTALMNHDTGRWLLQHIALSETNRKYLVLANSGLCGVLALLSMFAVDDAQGGSSVLYLLPAVFLGITSLAGRVITEVDVGELEKLRYEYKGA